MKELLELLEQDHRLTPQQLATMLCKRTEEVEAIIEEMEKDKVIVKYQTLINWEKAGVEKVTALIEVKVTPQREVGFESIAERIYRFPEVHSVSLVTGAYDLLVTVEGKNMKEIAHFVATKLATIEGVVNATTHCLLKKYKEAGVIMEDREDNRRLVVTP